ncbi:hypothetical protein K7I14_18180 [Aurantimonas coralicida]|nr:hypothetical protein [Aurantimonas coralicida]
MASRRRRSAAETEMVTPVRMQQTRMRAHRCESHAGLFRSGQSTSMIESQRSYSANSKVFQTGAEILEVLVNLKR